MGEEYDYENMIDLEAKHAVELRDREIQEEHERNPATERMYSQMGDYSYGRQAAHDAAPTVRDRAERRLRSEPNLDKISRNCPLSYANAKAEKESILCESFSRFRCP